MASPLVRGLLRFVFVVRVVAIPVVLLTLLSQPASAQTPTVPYRDEILRLLQQLLATGYPLDNEHDEGEWLQAAVTYAIYVRDREIEDLAIRAAVPLRARINRPVSSIEGPACLQVLSYKVLKLPHQVSYVANLQASLDDGAFIELGRHVPESECIALARLGTGALRPGTHVVRLRAHLLFGDPQQPLRLEVRELEPVSYALYDPTVVSVADARRFIFSPLSFRASDLDSLLPREPFLKWLIDTLGTRWEIADSRMWLSRYCAELTEEQHARHSGATCSAILFGNGGSIGQIWFRTGYVEMSDSGATWTPLERPSLEALFLSDGRTASRLSALPVLLNQPVEQHPSVKTLSLPDIDITPALPKPGAAAKVVITLHNTGELPIQNVMLQVIHLDGQAAGGGRRFVIDVPAFSSTSVSLDVTFRSGYGLMLAQPFIKDHGIVQDLMGPPLESPCAVRVVNAAAAPRDYLRANVGHMIDCVSR